MDFLLRYEWPGNIRELMNLIERINIDPPLKEIGVADLPESMRSPLPTPRETVPAEREILLYTLSQTNWNKSQAAEAIALVPHDALPEDSEVPSGRTPNRYRPRSQ